MVTIVLADDHVVVRQGLRALLETDPKVVVVGEASDGLEAIEVVKRHNPGVLIVDLMMPGMDGLETLRKVSRLQLGTRVIILSMYGNEAYVLEAVRNGAAGYVAKESCGAELFEAIRVVTAGRCYVSPSLHEASIDSYLHKTQKGSPDPYDTLTPRERKVLQLDLEGATGRDIGIRLQISSRTVEFHRANFMRKLGLKTHDNLLHYALQRGIALKKEPKSLGKKDNK